MRMPEKAGVLVRPYDHLAAIAQFGGVGFETGTRGDMGHAGVA